MFCPVCGATDVEMVDGICKNCYLKKFQLMEIPENITVTICKHCNSKLEEGKWKDEYIPEDEIIYRALENNITLSELAENEEIELEIDQMRGTIAECYVEAVATVLGEEIVETHTPNVKINYSVCPDCSKRNAGYYEAVIQLRADNRDLKEGEIEKAEEIVNRTLNKQYKKDKLAYVPQVAKLKEGNDYYIGSLKSAKKVVEHLKEEFGGKIKESPRLISEDKSTGKGLYRIWISLRLPKFEVSFEKELNNTLREMGLKNAFDSLYADLSGLGSVPEGNNLYINLVKQKAKLILDEEGTEASAATMAEVKAESAMEYATEPVKIYFDQPFLYMIIQKTNKVPLFMGIMDKPEN